MEGKSAPPKSGESHMRRKKGETEGKFRPPGEPRIPREGQTSYPEPRYLPPVYRRDNTHSRTTADSSPMRGRTKGKREGCGHRNDGVFTPKQRAQQLQQNFARVVFFFLPAFVRRKEPIGLAGPRDNERQVTTILSVSPRKPERVLFDART